jgi:predicted metal-dependent phosphoesterase TrpH
VPCKVDFHTHSIASPDGSLTEAQYRRILQTHKLDYVAVTDHNTTDMAKQLQTTLGNQIIVGEEITAQEGEIIGLYLQETIPPFLSAKETVARIHQQGGLVYIPHPFETVRKGLALSDLEAIANDVDAIEIHNGRAVFQNRSPQTIQWAADHQVPGAASSDAHGWSGWGRTHTLLGQAPSRDTLVHLLHQAQYAHAFPGLRGMLYPKLNRIKKWKWEV